MTNPILKFMQQKEAFYSCQIEGLVPKEWTFSDYLYNESLKERKEERRLKKLEKLVKKNDNNS